MCVDGNPMNLGEPGLNGLGTPEGSVTAAGEAGRRKTLPKAQCQGPTMLLVHRGHIGISFRIGRGKNKLLGQIRF